MFGLSDLEKLSEATRENRRKMIEELSEYYLVPKDVFDYKSQQTLNRSYKRMLITKAES